MIELVPELPAQATAQAIAQAKRPRGRPKLISNIEKTPPERLQAFLEFYLDGLIPSEAWVKAGYSTETRYKARAQLREHWKFLEKMIEERIGSHVPGALATIVDIMNTASSQQTRLLAAKDLLDRAGKKAPSQINISHREAESMADTDIDAEILALVKKVGIQAD